MISASQEPMQEAQHTDHHSQGRTPTETVRREQLIGVGFQGQEP